MIHHKKTKYILELDAKEFATFIAATNLLTRDKLEKHFGKYLDENVYNILVLSKTSILQTLYKNSNDSFSVPSDMIKDVLKGEELK